MDAERQLTSMYRNYHMCRTTSMWDAAMLIWQGIEVPAWLEAEPKQVRVHFFSTLGPRVLTLRDRTQDVGHYL